MLRVFIRIEDILVLVLLEQPSVVDPYIIIARPHGD
jgi:hypothetical protein